MANTGWIYAGTGTNGTPSGGVYDWATPTNIVSNNGVEAVYVTPGGSAQGTSKSLRAKSFGFSIPAGSTIDGIESRHESKTVDIVGTLNEYKETTYQLIKTSSYVGSNRRGNQFLGANAVYTRGSSSDLWGTTWSYSQINSSNFGVGFRVTSSGLVAFIHMAQAETDYIQIRVYYTEPLADPSSVVATVVDHNSVTVTWNDNSTGETGFRVQRSVNDGTWTTINTTAAGAESYTDNTASEGTKNEYRIRAEGTNPSNNVESGDAHTPPQIPTACAIDTVESNQIEVSWNDNSSVENNYEISRSVDGGGFSVLSASLAANTEAYVDSTVLPDTDYQYRVRALDTNANSGYSTSGTEHTPISFIPSMVIM